MGKLIERNEELLDRIRHLDRIGPQVKQLLEAGKREQLGRGVDADGNPFAPLKPSTLKHRRAYGPPLGGADSSIARSYEITVSPADDGVKITGTFRGKPWLHFHRTGTRHMVARDPGGFRREDVDEVKRIARGFIFDG